MMYSTKKYTKEEIFMRLPNKGINKNNMQHSVLLFSPTDSYLYLGRLDKYDQSHNEFLVTIIKNIFPSQYEMVRGEYVEPGEIHRANASYIYTLSESFLGSTEYRILLDLGKIYHKAIMFKTIIDDELNNQDPNNIRLFDKETKKNNDELIECSLNLIRSIMAHIGNLPGLFNSVHRGDMAQYLKTLTLFGFSIPQTAIDIETIKRQEYLKRKGEKKK